MTTYTLSAAFIVPKPTPVWKIDNAWGKKIAGEQNLFSLTPVDIDNLDLPKQYDLYTKQNLDTCPIITKLTEDITKLTEDIAEFKRQKEEQEKSQFFLSLFGDVCRIVKNLVKSKFKSRFKEEFPCLYPPKITKNLQTLLRDEKISEEHWKSAMNLCHSRNSTYHCLSGYTYDQTRYYCGMTVDTDLQEALLAFSSLVQKETPDAYALNKDQS